MIVYVLNLLDLACTYYFLCRGGEELNPVAQWLIEVHPVAFPFAKIIVAGALCYMLEHLAKTEPATKIALWIITGWYTAIVAYYILLILGGII